MQRKRISCWPAAGLLVLAALTACRPGTSEADIERAVAQLQVGEDRQAIELLRRIADDYPQGKVGDRASLCLGNALIHAKRHQEAVPFLRRASAGLVGPHYAQLLLIRAVSEGELESDFAEAEQLARTLSDSPALGPVVQEEARFGLFRLLWLQKSYNAAAQAGQDFLQRFPDSRHADEARWFTARSLQAASRLEEALRLCEAIWYETPSSPWALESEKALLELSRLTRKPPRSLSAAQHHRFIGRLQRAGLHEKALDWIASFLAKRQGNPRTDDVLLMKARSLHAVRRNDDCVAAADQLRRRFPRSSLAASGGLVAIQCLRRSDSEAAIRQWVSWIVTQFPGSGQSQEALYNLGSFLNNVVSREQGLQVLRRLVQGQGDSGPVRDAYWTAAWILRNQGKTREAADLLADLLRRFPRTGYRQAALYWQARFTAEWDRSQAVRLYQSCLSEFPNDYYGHQSRENLLALGSGPSAPSPPTPFPPIDLLEDPAKLSQRGEDYRRAAHLKSLGLYELAALELEREPVADHDKSLRFSLAFLYSRSGNPWEAVSIVRKNFSEFITSGSRDPRYVPGEFWQIVYPYNYRAEISQAIRDAGLEGTRIDAFLVAALIRHESLFLPSAVSPVGALGLMQLMPATADAIARERGIPAPSHAELFDPAVNIRYGVYYLANLVREFNGDWFPAICAYNAGPGPVKAWWSKRSPDQQLDEFIENIPYTATRRYVKDVLGDYKNYVWIYSPGS